MNKILILGVGNILLTDEGVGVHTIYELEKEEWPGNVTLLDGGTGGIHLTGDLQEFDTIIMIDATLDDSPPGTIRLLRPRRALDFPPLMSAHEIGLQDMITVMVLTDNLPDIRLITVSVKNINRVSMELSPEIRACIPHVKKLVRLVLESVLSTPVSGTVAGYSVN